MLNPKLAELISRVNETEDKTIFFLGGMIKSGTTWVERIFDVHPNVVCKGEAHFGSLLEPALSEAVANYNAVIPKKGNWNRHSESGIEPLPATTYSYLTFDVDFMLRQSMLLMLQKWVTSGDIRCVGEKTPNNTRYFGKLAYLFPNARFVYVIRDIRDIIVSGWFFNMAVNPGKTQPAHNRIEDYALPMIQRWENDVSEGLTFIDNAGKNGTFVRYEDIIENPRREIAGLYEFLGVDCSEPLVSQCASLTAFKSLSGGREHGEENRSSFYRKGVVGDWENHLSSTIVDQVATECGPLMEWLGYELN